MTPDRHPGEDELVRAHLHLANQAVSELARRLPSHVNRDDLCSAAMLGLAQAARSWDPDRGAGFERHAATRIRGALLDELRDSDWASRSVRSRARRLQQAGEELTGRLGRAPTQDELAAELGTDTRAVHRLVDDVHRATGLNYESIVADGDADDLPLSGDRAPDHGRDRVSRLPAPGRGPDPAPRRPQRPPRPGHPPGRAPARQPPAPTSGPGWTRPRGPCSSGPPRTAGRHPRQPESPFRQRIRLARSLLDNISSFSPSLPVLLPSRRYAPFAPGLERLWRVMR